MSKALSKLADADRKNLHTATSLSPNNPAKNVGLYEAEKENTSGAERGHLSNVS